MYNRVGISGCEPPQPQQFGRKIKFLQEFIAFTAAHF
jgi:hypothetical protein